MDQAVPQDSLRHLDALFDTALAAGLHSALGQHAHAARHGTYRFSLYAAGLATADRRRLVARATPGSRSRQFGLRLPALGKHG
jgi:hypothetical protein